MGRASLRSMNFSMVGSPFSQPSLERVRFEHGLAEGFVCESSPVEEPMFLREDTSRQSASSSQSPKSRTLGWGPPSPFHENGWWKPGAEVVAIVFRFGPNAACRPSLCGDDEPLRRCLRGRLPPGTRHGFGGNKVLLSLEPLTVPIAAAAGLPADPPPRLFFWVIPSLDEFCLIQRAADLPSSTQAVAWVFCREDTR